MGRRFLPPGPASQSGFWYSVDCCAAAHDGSSFCSVHVLYGHRSGHVSVHAAGPVALWRSRRRNVWSSRLSARGLRLLLRAHSGIAGPGNHSLCPEIPECNIPARSGRAGDDGFGARNGLSTTKMTGSRRSPRAITLGDLNFPCPQAKMARRYRRAILLSIDHLPSEPQRSHCLAHSALSGSCRRPPARKRQDQTPFLADAVFHPYRAPGPN